MVNLTDPPTDGTEAPADTRIADLERQLAEFKAEVFVQGQLLQALLPFGPPRGRPGPAAARSSSAACRWCAMTVAVTAHAGLDVCLATRRRDPREVIHAVLDAPVHLTERGPLGTADRAAGEAVCAEPSEFGEPPAALWEPVITCPGCAVLVRAWGIELVGCSQ